MDLIPFEEDGKGRCDKLQQQAIPSEWSTEEISLLQEMPPLLPRAPTGPSHYSQGLRHNQDRRAGPGG